LFNTNKDENMHTDVFDMDKSLKMFPSIETGKKTGRFSIENQIT
jgi:hypothetical protein